MNAVLVNDLKLFSNDMISKFRKKKLPDIQSFQKDVEKANTHITRYQEIIEDLQNRINEQNKGIHVDMNQNLWDGNYFCMSNLSQEHLEKIRQVGEAVNKFSELVQDFIRVFKEEFAQWVINKPQEELSPLENVTLKITDAFSRLEHVSIQDETFEVMVVLTCQRITVHSKRASYSRVLSTTCEQRYHYSESSFEL